MGCRSARTGTVYSASIHNVAHRQCRRCGQKKAGRGKRTRHRTLHISVACLQTHRPFIFQLHPSYTTSRRLDPRCRLPPLSLSAVLGNGTLLVEENEENNNVPQRPQHLSVTSTSTFPSTACTAQNHGRLYSNPPTHSPHSCLNALPAPTHAYSSGESSSGASGGASSTREVEN
ncbi:hypothetical protein AX14_000288 [Amanita brunnescens Koide BX004]|nr:hypothetical protein AX14_000288 [Amanita brunnescens Koide BX004]